MKIEKIKKAHELIMEKEELENKIQKYSDTPLNFKYPCLSYEYYADSNTGDKTIRIPITDGQMRGLIKTVCNDLQVQIHKIDDELQTIFETTKE